MKKHTLMIKQIVNNLVITFETRNPFKLIQELNIIILYVPLVDVNGFYQHWNGVDIIYLNDKLNDREQRIVASHELGHMVLHRNLNCFFLNRSTNLIDKYEVEADTFASELLISDDDIIEHQHLTKIQLSNLLNVDEKLIDLKLKAQQNQKKFC